MLFASLPGESRRRQFIVLLVLLKANLSLECSFLATTTTDTISNLSHVNEFMRRRGPDGTRCLGVGGIGVCHNLLHMTGEMRPQPFFDEDAGVLVVYNGEVYNYEELGSQLGVSPPFQSDGEAILPLYRRYGEKFPSLLDGEFAIAVFDLAKGIAILAVDAFSTKPLWYSRWQGLRVASYRSGVERLGAPLATIRMLDPNTVLVLRIAAGTRCPILARHAVYEFDLRQFKTDTSDFLHSFARAVERRARSKHPSFIGLSSGYDSGAIQAALKHLSQRHGSYTIYATEDIDMIYERLAWTGEIVESNIIRLSENDRLHEESYLRTNCENFLFSGVGRLGTLFDDPASHGLSYIFRIVRQRGILTYLSGTGADEIISDYGHGGKKFFPHSNFGGLWPEDLSRTFPWPSWFLGTQRDYLMKEELVAGAHGIESRYPFLDRRVVQEYLWLAAPLKNSQYKAPLHGWLERVGYPFRAGEKLGFNADWTVREGGSVLYSNRKHHIASSTPEASSGIDIEALRKYEHTLDARQSRIEERRVLLSEAEANAKRREKELERNDDDVDKAFATIKEDRMQKIQSMLHLNVPRLSVLQHSSLSDHRDDSSVADEFVHEEWSAVEVVTCVSGGLQASVADFPVFKIFHALTPLYVHNVCENVEWEGMHFRLRMYNLFFQDLKENGDGLARGTKPKLYYVVDGLDLFFNDLSEILSTNRSSVKAHRVATAKLIAERFEAVTGAFGSPRRQIVASTERLCGWGGARFCSDDEVARYPPSPTDSKFLNAGGYLGSADALAIMVSAVLKMKESATGDEQEKSRDSDQYFFKRYFWENPDLIAMDYNQSIFGNFLEIVPTACDGDWRPVCAITPCCTESDNFRNFHKVFYTLYKVQGCAVWRDKNLPISWHGNGAGKWFFLLALDRLSLQCPPVANLTVQGHPLESIGVLFQRFNDYVADMDSLQHAIDSPAAAWRWRGGSLLTSPDSAQAMETHGSPSSCEKFFAGGSS